MSLTERLQIPERLKYIHCVADIVKQNVVKFFSGLECLVKFFLVRESDCEIQGWITLLCDFDYLGGDIDAFPMARVDGCQKRADVTSNREDSFLRFHQESKKTGQ